MERNDRIRPDDHRLSDGLNGASLTALFRQLADESASLVRNEARLAKLEIKETSAAMAKHALMIAVGTGLAASGGLALTAFLVIVIGNALGGAYWAGALIVGAGFLLIGAIVASIGVRNLRQESIAPEQTIRSLQEDGTFLKHEARDFRNELMS